MILLFKYLISNGKVFELGKDIVYKVLNKYE